MSNKISFSDMVKKSLPKKAVEEFTQFVTERVYSSLLHAEDKPRSPGLHVSSLLTECMRRPAYSILFGRPMDMRGIYRTGIGTALHSKIKILEKQEIPLEWEGIVTDGIDEYSPEWGIWLDKKFTWGPPDWDVWPYHRMQGEYYKNMMVNNDMKATHGFIVYFDLSNPKVHVRYINKIRALDTIAKEMLKKRDIIKETRKTAVLPPRKIGKDCFFCDYAKPCLRGVL